MNGLGVFVHILELNVKDVTFCPGQAYVHRSVMEELKRIIDDSEITKEDDALWPPPDRVGRQVCLWVQLGGLWVCSRSHAFFRFLFLYRQAGNNLRRFAACQGKYNLYLLSHFRDGQTSKFPLIICRNWRSSLEMSISPSQPPRSVPSLTSTSQSKCLVQS